jgi:hypothetical protein
MNKEASVSAAKSLQEIEEKLNAAQDELGKLKSQSVEQLEKSHESHEEKIRSMQQKHEELFATELNQLKKSHLSEVAKLRHGIDADTKKKIDEATRKVISERDAEVSRVKAEY